MEGNVKLENWKKSYKVYIGERHMIQEGTFSKKFFNLKYKDEIDEYYVDCDMEGNEVIDKGFETYAVWMFPVVTGYIKDVRTDIIYRIDISGDDTVTVKKLI